MRQWLLGILEAVVRRFGRKRPARAPAETPPDIYPHF
jgi:hypothetical protein